MKGALFEGRLWMRDSRVWLGIGGILLVAIMLTISDYRAMAEMANRAPSAHYFFVMPFAIDLGMATYLVAASQASVAQFCKDYGHNRLYFILPRTGYWGYAWRLVWRTFWRTYLIGIGGGSLFLTYLLLRFPLYNPQGIDGISQAMINNWLLGQGHVWLFYISLISIVGMMVAFYTLLSLLVTIYYPNKMTSYMLPVFWWFILTQFQIDRLIPFFLLPHYLFTADEVLESVMTRLQVGTVGFRRLVALSWPYLYFLIVACLIAWLIQVALKRRWHFYDKEGI